ncbi:MAG: ArsR/SmtB family transcription factor [Gemmatimonadaceae bacterium]
MVKSRRYDLDLVFHALADPTRRGILRDLTRRERTVSELAKPHRMSLVGVSKHLKVLERARLIERRRDGSFHFMRLNPAALQSADAWLRHYERFWNDRLDALTHLLETEEA